jgi:RsiW-degrading membrane proteinase PrsW (M82 family)
MECPVCSTTNPEVATFCLRCGEGLRAGVTAGARRRASNYAANPAEPVLTVGIVTTLMPHAAGSRPSTYRTALVAGALLPLLGAALGVLPFALVAAALLIPVVYILYLYDVNMWEDQPVLVVAGAALLSGALALGFTLLWREWLFHDIAVASNLRLGELRVEEALVFGLLVPVVATLLMQIGPVLLASRPQFDDLLDGLTFGVVSGVSFAAVETLVTHGSVIFDAPLRTRGTEVSVWIAVVVTAGILKPLLYGTVTGLATARFSGLGEGVDGFTGRYSRAVLEAAAFLVLFHLGGYLLGLVQGAKATVLSALWSAALVAAAVVRLRAVLHTALLEGALEAAAGGGRHATLGGGYCQHCELPLLDGSLFCVACGSSVRAMSKQVRALNVGDDGPPQPAAVTGRSGR